MFYASRKGLGSVARRMKQFGWKPAKLLTDLGVVCSIYQDRVMRDLPCERIQCDEIWSFVGMKQKNVPAEKQGEFGYGDVWTWVAIDADTKLVPSYRVGSRDIGDAHEFIADLAKRLSNRVQLTTDGLRVYLSAVERAFDGEIDYAQLVKIYGAEGKPGRYSPPVCLGRSLPCSTRRRVDGMIQRRLRIDSSRGSRAETTGSLFLCPSSLIRQIVASLERRSA